MDSAEIQLIGSPCGQHGPYTFYKAFKYAKNGERRIMALSEFFFVKLWVDSDLVCIGELQLLWVDRNSDQVLTSLRLYFLPENTPDGRMDHGEDEVLAISEKVVLRVEDLITWIITVDAAWSWGRILDRDGTFSMETDENDEECGNAMKGDSNGRTESDLIVPQTLTETALDFTEVNREKAKIGPSSANPTIVILNYPRYCRYRATMKRMEGVADNATRVSIVTTLGGYQTVPASARTRVLFCRDTFDYPELEGHELLCNHLAPKLKGRPRGKRKKLRSVSPVGSESNESESSDALVGQRKVTGKITTGGGRNGLRCDTTTSPRRSARAAESTESKNFVKKLTTFMKSNRTPIGRIPSIGYKELDLYQFYVKVQKLGGYDAVTSNRQWKTIFDNLSLTGASTSAATVVRRHYERFLLSYERHQKGEQDKPLPVSERRRLKSKAAAAAAAAAAAVVAAASGASDADTSEGASRSGTSTPTPTPGTSGLHTGASGAGSGGQSMSPPTPTDTKEFSMSKCEGKTSSLRSVRVKSERMRDSTRDKVPLERTLSIEDTSSSHPSTSSKTPSPKPDGSSCSNLRDEPKLTTTIINEHKILIKVKGQDKLFDSPKEDDRPLKELRDGHRAKLLEQVNDDLRMLRQLKEDKLQKHQYKLSKQSQKHAAQQAAAKSEETAMHQQDDVQQQANIEQESFSNDSKMYIDEVVQSDGFFTESKTEEQQEPVKLEDIKPLQVTATESVGGKTPPSISVVEKCVEPLTTAIAPVQKGSNEPSSSPVIAEAKTYVSTSLPINPISSAIDAATAAPPDDHLIATIPTTLSTPTMYLATQPQSAEIIDLDADTRYSSVTTPTTTTPITTTTTTPITTITTTPITTITTTTTTTTTTTSVKKAKLDILKEGGLEVTPVKGCPGLTTKVLSTALSPTVLSNDEVVCTNAASATDGASACTNASRVRASVIQQARERLSNQELSISVTPEKQRRLPPAMPPPTINATLIKAPLPSSTTSRNHTPLQQLKNNNILTNNNNNNNKNLSISAANQTQPYHNGERTPPKLQHQSMSIYSPQAKTIYGDPRLLFSPPIQNMQVAAGSIKPSVPNNPLPIDILDLTLSNSPQPLTQHKSPHVEITRVDRGHTHHTAARIDLTTRQGYKSTVGSSGGANIPDVSRLGSNIEITLVGKPPYQSHNSSKAPSNAKQHSTKHHTLSSPTTAIYKSSQNHKRHHNFTNMNNSHKTSLTSSQTASSHLPSENGTSSGKRSRLDSLQSGSLLTVGSGGSATYSGGKTSGQKQQQQQSKNSYHHHMELNVPNPYGSNVGGRVNATTGTGSNRGNGGYGSGQHQSSAPQQQPSPNTISPKIYSHLFNQYMPPPPPSPSALSSNSQQLNSPTPLSTSSSKSNLGAISSSLGGLSGLLQAPLQFHQQQQQHLGQPASLLDPFYYQAQALQSAWPSGYPGLPSLFPIPSAEQLHFYSELMAHNARLGLPFPGAMMMMDSVKGGATSAVDGNCLKKHQQ